MKVKLKNYLIFLLKRVSNLEALNNCLVKMLLDTGITSFFLFKNVSISSFELMEYYLSSSI